MVRKLKPVLASEGDDLQVFVTYKPSVLGPSKKPSPTSRTIDAEKEWTNFHATQFDGQHKELAILDPALGRSSVKKSEQNVPVVSIVPCRERVGHNIEKNNKAYIFDHQHEERQDADNDVAQSREDVNRQTDISSDYDETNGQQQGQSQEEIGGRFSHNFPDNNRTLPTLKSTSSDVGDSRYTGVTGRHVNESRERVSRSLSPMKRSRGKGRLPTKARMHSSLSPRTRRRKRSTSKSPQRKCGGPGKVGFGKGELQKDEDSPSRIGNKKTAVSRRDFTRSRSRQQDSDSATSDEALEFTKARYTKRISKTTNRQDVSLVTRPKPQSKPISISQKKHEANTESSDDIGSFQDTTHLSSSEYESSTTGASFTEAEKLRLRRQLKRRAVLKLKAAKTAHVKSDPMSFMDNALVIAASDFVSSIVGQLGLGQPFVFPTSPLGGESELNDDYNLLRWEDDTVNKTKPDATPKTSPSTYGNRKLEGKNGEKEGRGCQKLSDDESDQTQRMSKSGSMHKHIKKTVVDTRKTTQKVKAISTPFSCETGAPIIQSAKGSGPAIIDERQISEVARSMAKLQDTSMTSEDGETSRESSSHSVESDEGFKSAEDLTKNSLDSKTGKPMSYRPATLKDDTKREDDRIDYSMSSDSPKIAQHQTVLSDDAEDEDIHSLTYSLEESNNLSSPSADFLARNEKEDSSVANLVSKFEKAIPMRQSERSYAPILPQKEKPVTNELILPQKEKPVTNELIVALSLSADDSLLPSSGRENTTYSEISGKRQAFGDPKLIKSEQVGFDSLPSTPHMEELKKRIHEFKERKEKLMQQQSSKLHDTAKLKSNKPETTPSEARTQTKSLGLFATAASDHDISSIVDDPSEKFQSCATIINTSHRPACGDGKREISLADTLVSRIGNTSLGKDSLTSCQSVGPQPVDMDDLVSKLEGVVKRLIISGKLPGIGNDISQSDVEKRTLRTNTAELLRNIDALKKSRNSTEKQKQPMQFEENSNPSPAAEKEQEVQASPFTQSDTDPKPSLITPKPPVMSSTTTSNDDKMLDTMIRRYDGGGKCLSNLARIRARRDEAAMLIKEKTHKLAGGRAIPGPIAIVSTPTQNKFSQSRAVERTGNLWLSRLPITVGHGYRFDHVNNRSIPSPDRPRPRGPPRPEDTNTRQCDSAATRQKGNTSIMKNQRNVVAMSTSDMDMEEWEQLELEKLPLLLSKTKSEEQGEARFSTINYDNARSIESRDQHITTPRVRQNLGQHTSVIDAIDEFEDTEDETDDTDSTGSFGSESDSERLERIASMIQELRIRRQRRR